MVRIVHERSPARGSTGARTGVHGGSTGNGGLSSDDHPAKDMSVVNVGVLSRFQARVSARSMHIIALEGPKL